jgi:heme oxygenase
MILESLKARTADSHRRVEESKLLQPLTAPSLTPGAYCSILRKFYGYFQPLEDRVASINGLRELLPDFPHRRKASLLRQDLAALPGGETIKISL